MTDTPPAADPTDPTPPPTPKKSGAQYRKEARERQQGTADAAPRSAGKAAKAPGRPLSADAQAIRAGATELVGLGAALLIAQGTPAGLADATVLATYSDQWTLAFAQVVDKHPQLKRALAGGAGKAPELSLALATFQVVMALKANHPAKAKPLPEPTTPEAPPAPSGPAAPLVGVPNAEDVPPEVRALLTDFRLPTPPR